MKNMRRNRGLKQRHETQTKNTRRGTTQEHHNYKRQLTKHELHLVFRLC